MKKILNIKEYFDTIEDYQENEIPYITGEIKDDLIKVIDKGIDTFDKAPDMLKVYKQITLNNVFLHEGINIADDDNITIIFKDDKADTADNVFFINIINKGLDKYETAYGIALDGKEYAIEAGVLNLQELDKAISGKIYDKFKEDVEAFKERDINIFNKPLKNANFRLDFNSVIYNYDEYLDKK